MKREGTISRWAMLLLIGVSITQLAQGQGAKRLTGTAFVVDANGYLLTAAHVVKGAVKVEVTLGDKTYNAAVVATDEKRDLALLEIKAKGLPALPLGNSNGVEVGEEVRAFGFPLTSVLGEGVKVTRGIVSGIETKDAQRVFQIDAPINPGNSGGPLVNEKGEVIAVINAKLAGTLISNIAFAVPVNYAKTMLRDNGVGFASEGSKTKLDGPALVGHVSPAVALLTVNAKDGTTTHPTSTPAPALRPTERLNPQDGSTMVFVPAGDFIMGSDDGIQLEKPAHRVYLDDFWIDKYEVTNEQYAKFLDSIKRTGDHSKCFQGEPANKDHTPHYWNDTKFNAAKQPVGAWTGMTLMLTRRGQGNACQRRRSGRRRRGVPTDASIRGGTSGMAAAAVGQAIQAARRKRWAVSLLGQALMGHWTWRGMSGSGARIGMRVIQARV